MPLTRIDSAVGGFVEFEDAGTLEVGGAVLDAGGALLDEAGALLEKGGALLDDGGALLDDAGALLDDPGALVEGAGTLLEADDDDRQCLGSGEMVSFLPAQLTVRALPIRRVCDELTAAATGAAKATTAATIPTILVRAHRGRLACRG